MNRTFDHPASKMNKTGVNYIPVPDLLLLGQDSSPNSVCSSWRSKTATLLYFHGLAPDHIAHRTSIAISQMLDVHVRDVSPRFIISTHLLKVIVDSRPRPCDTIFSSL